MTEKDEWRPVVAPITPAVFFIECDEKILEERMKRRGFTPESITEVFAQTEA